VLTGLVNISLVDDNLLMLDCGSSGAEFVEDMGTAISVTANLTLADLDPDHVVPGASVAIMGAQDGDEITVDESLSGSISIQHDGGRTHIDLIGDGMAEQYQVRRHRMMRWDKMFPWKFHNMTAQ